MPSSKKQIELKLVISALDKATKTLDGIASDLNKIVENTQKAGNAGEKAWRDSTKAAAKYEDRLERLQKEYRSVSQQANRYWTTMKGMAAMLAGVGAAAIFPIRSAAKFERAMSRVVAVTTGAAGRYEEISKKARELGRDTLYTSEQAAQGMKYLGMTGLNAAQTIEAIGPALDLATLGEMELAKAADYATNIMMGFDKSVEDLTHIINVMAHAATNSNQSVTELAQAMSYVAPVANAAGVSLEQTTAAIGLLSDRGIKASKAGTALRGVIASLTDPTKEALGALRELGVQIQYNADGSLNLIGTLDELNRAGLDSGKAFQIFRRTAAAAAQAMTSNVDQMRSFSQEMTTGVEGAAKRFRQLLEDNFIGQLIKLQAAFNNLLISIGSPFLEWLTQATTGISNWLSTAAEWLNQNKNVAVSIGAVIAALTAFLAIGLTVATMMWASTKATQAYYAALIGLNKILLATSGQLSYLSPALASTLANFKNNSIVVRGFSASLAALNGMLGITTARLGMLAAAARATGSAFIWMFKWMVAPFAVGWAIGSFIGKLRTVREITQLLIADFATFYHDVAGWYTKLKLKAAEFALKVAEVNPLADKETVEGHKKIIANLEEQIDTHEKKASQAVQTRKTIEDSFEREKEAAEETKDAYEKQQEMMKELERETKKSARIRAGYAKDELDQFTAFIEGKKGAAQEYTAFEERLQKDLVEKKEELSELEITQQRVIEQEKGLAQQNAAKVRVENKRQEIEQIQRILDKGVDEYLEAEGKKEEYLKGSLQNRLDILQTHLSEARIQYEKGTQERARIESLLIPKIEELENELTKISLSKVRERYNLYSQANEERLSDYKRVLDTELNYAADANGKLLWMAKDTYSDIRGAMMDRADALKQSYDRELEIIQAQKGREEITHEESVQKRQVLTSEYNRRMATLYDELLNYAKTTYGENSEEWRRVQESMKGHTDKFVNATTKRYEEMRDTLIETFSDTKDALQDNIEDYTDKIREATQSMADRQMGLEDDILDIRRKHMSEEQKYESYRNEAIEKRRKLEEVVNNVKRNAADMSQEELDRAYELAETYESDVTRAYKRFADSGKAASNTAIAGLKTVNGLMTDMDQTKVDSFTRLKQQADEALSRVERWIEEFNRRAELKIPVRLTDLRKAVDQVNQMIPEEENKIKLDVPDEDIKRAEEVFDRASRLGESRKVSFDVETPGLEDTEREITNKARAISKALGISISEAMDMSIREGLGDMVGTFRNSQGKITETWKQESGERIQIVRNEAGEIVRAGNVMTRSMDDQADAAKDVKDAQGQTSKDVENTATAVGKATRATKGLKDQSKGVADEQRKVTAEVRKTSAEVEKAAATPAEKALRVVLRNFEKVKDRIEKWADEEITKTVRIKTVEEHGIGGRAGEIYKMASGGRFPGDSKKDSIHVMARPGEGFVRNEALGVWDRMFGKGFFHGINDPWSAAGQNIINTLKGNLSVSIPDIQQASAPKIQFASGGRVPDRPAQDLGTIQFEVDGNTYPVQGDVDVLTQLHRAIERKQRLRKN